MPNRGFSGDEKGQLVSERSVAGRLGLAEWPDLVGVSKLARWLHCHVQVAGPVHF